jgi:toxin ParE1/3/4
MADYYFTKKAVEDLSGIWDYTIEKWSEQQADKYYQMLIDFCKEIASNPGMGKSYPGIASNLSGFKAGRHVIFYRIMNENQIEITRILHERMDLKNRIVE